MVHTHTRIHASHTPTFTYTHTPIHIHPYTHTPMYPGICRGVNSEPADSELGFVAFDLLHLDGPFILTLILALTLNLNLNLTGTTLTYLALHSLAAT